MQIDRVLHLDILRILQEAYPDQAELDALLCADQMRLQSNLWYLREHGLVEVIDCASMGNPTNSMAPRITARGIDFLADDGGLSASCTRSISSSIPTTCGR